MQRQANAKDGSPHSGKHPSTPPPAYAGFGKVPSATQLSPSAAQLTRSTSAPSLTRLPSGQVPESIRTEFVRFSTPLHGPSGRNNLKLLHKYLKFQRYIEGAENRGVALMKLIEVYRYAAGHCCEWQVSLATLNHYQLNKWIVRPVTKDTNSAMAEHLSNKKLLPTWFISHWWGDLVDDFVKSLRQHMGVRGLSNNTTFYWISLYALRQHDLQNELCMDPRQSSFFKAMRLAHFKVLIILNSENYNASCRMWCCFEFAMCADRAQPTFDVAARCGNEVELVTCGLTTSEIHGNNYFPGRGLAVKIKREESFPDYIIKNLLTFDFAKTETSVAQDRVRMLNCITGSDLHSEPAFEHDKYYEASRRLRSLFALIFWHRAMAAERPEQEGALKRHTTFLAALGKAIAGDWWRRSLTVSLAGCSLCDAEMVDLVTQSFPPNLLCLKLDLQHTELTNESLASLACGLPPQLVELSLDVAGCEVGDGGVLEFLKQLPEHVQKLSFLGLPRTKASAGVVELVKDPLEELRSWAEMSALDQKEILLAKVAAQAGANWSPGDVRAAQLEHNRRVALESMLQLPASKLNEELRRKIEADLAALGENDVSHMI